MTSPTAEGVTHRWTSLHDFVKEVSEARIWAGFHYPSSDEYGSHLGRKVGRFVTQRFFRPLGCHSAGDAPDLRPDVQP